MRVTIGGLRADYSSSAPQRGLSPRAARVVRGWATARLRRAATSRCATIPSERLSRAPTTSGGPDVLPSRTSSLLPTRCTRARRVDGAARRPAARSAPRPSKPSSCRRRCAAPRRARRAARAARARAPPSWHAASARAAVVPAPRGRVPARARPRLLGDATAVPRPPRARRSAPRPPPQLAATRPRRSSSEVARAASPARRRGHSARPRSNARARTSLLLGRPRSLPRPQLVVVVPTSGGRARGSSPDLVAGAPASLAPVFDVRRCGTGPLVQPPRARTRGRRAAASAHRSESSWRLALDLAPRPSRPSAARRSAPRLARTCTDAGGAAGAPSCAGRARDRRARGRRRAPGLGAPRTSTAVRAARRRTAAIGPAAGARRPAATLAWVRERINARLRL